MTIDKSHNIHLKYDKRLNKICKIRTLKNKKPTLISNQKFLLKIGFYHIMSVIFYF